MRGIYKVTDASVGRTKNGYKIYKLQLNGAILATKLFPLRKLDQKYNTLFNKYKENNDSLDFLVGKYISILLEKTQYGFEFSSIVSFDALTEFKDLLDSSNGKAFSTRINMYEFLEGRNYTANADGSLILKPPYDKFCLSKNNVCYPNDLKDNCLTPANIGFIFEKFYKGKVIDNGNPDRDESYVLTSAAIVRNRKIYHKTKGKTLSNSNFDVLRIGDPLTDEQYEYILNCKIEN